MRTCERCGAVLDDDASFCAICCAAQSSPAVGASFDESIDQVEASKAPFVPTSFGEAITICFNKYYDVQGRASRAEFWYWVLFVTIMDLIPVVNLGALFVLTPPTITALVRRLHDTNQAGWLVALLVILGGAAFVVLACGLLYASAEGLNSEDEAFLWSTFAFATALAFSAFVLTVRPGTPGPNKYGPAPVRR